MEQLMKLVLTGVATAVLASPVVAATQTVVLSVPAISCSACSTRIKAALAKVKGVSQAQVVLEKRQAVVAFDDSQTSVPALTKALADVGFPAVVVN